MYIILILPHNLPKQCHLSHAGALPWRFSFHCEMNKETISKKNTISTSFFSFLHARNRRPGGVDLHCRTGASACHCLISAFNLTFKCHAAAACMHLPPFFALTCSRLHNDLRQFIGDLLYLKAPRDRSTVALVFFFYFYFYCFLFFLHLLAQRIGSKPPPFHMKVFSFVRDLRTFEMTPKESIAQLKKKKRET